MMSREQFLADMIKELSRQQSEDAAGFNHARKLTDVDVFRKMCFSFPIVDRENIEELTGSLDKFLKQHNTSLTETFCLDEIFLENICSLSEKEDDKSAVAQVVAAQMFLKMPKHLLACDKGQLSRLFANYVHNDDEVSLPNGSRYSFSWRQCIEKFKSLVLRGNSSLLSGLSFKTVSEGFYLVSFLSVILCLDKLVQLSSSNPTGDARGSEKDYLDQLDEMWDTNPDSNPLTLEGVLQRIAHMNNEESGRVAMFKQLWLHCIFIYRDVLIRIPSLVGSYLSPLCEVLLQNSVSNSSSGGSDPGGQSADMSSLFSFKPKEATVPFPTSSECAFVMTVSNIATFLVSPPTTTATATTTTTTVDSSIALAQQLGSARSAMREYFTGKGRLVTLVDICERMAASSIRDAGVSSTLVGKGRTLATATASTASSSSNNSSNVIEVESVSFLLDVCSVYVSDLRNGAYTYNSSSSTTSGGGSKLAGVSPISTSKHFEALITSRALSTLVTALVNTIQQSVIQVGVIVSSTDEGTSSGAAQASQSKCSTLSALSARLLRFFTSACLHSGAVCSFLLATPDFISALNSLHATAWSPLLQMLQSASHTVSMRQVDDALGLFAPSSALGLLTVLILSSRDNIVTDLLCSLLELSVLLIAQHQCPLPGLQRTSKTSSVSTMDGGDSRSVDSFVIVETTAADSLVSSTVVEKEEAEEQYTPEEVAEKSVAQANGVETHRSVTRVMVSLTATVSLLTSEADGAPHMRAVFRPTTAGTALFKAQKLFRSHMVGELLRLTSSQLTALMAMESAVKESVEDVVAKQGVDLDSSDSASLGNAVAGSVKESAATPPPMNVRNIRIAHEGLKKQLKALQSLIEGNGSNKTD